MKRKLAIIVAALAVLAGVAYYEWLSPPSSFARRIAEADRLEVTIEGEPSSARMIVTGEELKRAVDMVSRARRDWRRYQAEFSVRAEFFKGAEAIGQMSVHLQLMRIDGAQYRDDSGLLIKLVAMPILHQGRP